MFRRLTKIGGVVAASGGGLTLCAASYPFETRGSSTTLTPPSALKSPPLSLAGVGMRRKNLYVVEVDVYLASLYLGQEALRAAKASKGQDPSLAGLPEALYLSTTAAVSGKQAPTAQAATTLHFVRDVGQQTVVDAFNDAFQGVDAASIASFKSALGETIGSNGMKAGECVTFYWMNASSGLHVEKNGVVSPAVRAPELERKLLKVYTAPDTAVSPELIKTLRDHLHCIV